MKGCERAVTSPMKNDTSDPVEVEAVVEGTDWRRAQDGLDVDGCTVEEAQTAAALLSGSQKHCHTGSQARLDL